MCILLFEKIISDFKEELNKDVEEDKGIVAKGSFGLTFDGVRDDKNNIKREISFSRKKEKAIIIHKECIIYKRPACKKLKAYYYIFPEIAPKKRLYRPVSRKLQIGT